VKRPQPHLLVVAVCGWLLVSSSAPHGAQTPAGPDGITRLLQKLEEVVRAGDPARYHGLLAAGAAGIETAGAAALAQSIIGPGATRVVVRERDRVPLIGVQPGAGFRLAVDVFTEFTRRARLATWRIDVVRRAPASSDGSDEWGIKAQETVSSFGGLYNLALGTREYAAKNLVLTAEDLELRLPAGAVFTAEVDDGPTVLVLLGRGQMVFRPTPATEREQMKIFARSEAIDTPFAGAFVRLSPSALQGHLAGGTMVECPLDANHAKEAAALFREDQAKSFGVNLADLTPENWSMVPGPADFLAEVHTSRFGVLTYARSMHEAEDVTLFDRARRRNISVYASREKLAQRGFFYDDDDGQDAEIIHYDIETSLDPVRQTIDGVGRLTAQIRGKSVSTLTFKLAESLDILSLVSREFGPLPAIRVRNQSGFIVNLPTAVPKGSVLGFTIAYRGRLAPQMIDREAIAVAGAPGQEQDILDPAPLTLEPSYLYSNRSYWYPQGETTSFATATLRVKVPPTFACVASGDPTPATAEAMSRAAGPGTELVFRALQPLRYLSVLITRLLPVSSQTVVASIDLGTASREAVGRSGVFYRDIALTTFASPRMRGRALPVADRAADILRFYASLVGDCPYPTLTLAVVERELPGGHSPAYLAVLSQPAPSTPYTWQSDPTTFAEFPEFFLAHEIAHQWWGQAVGWKNYHEQWLSEGLSQYFAALYAEQLRGKAVFGGIVGRLQDWAMKKSGEGPVYLGYRIGHVKSDPQLFRAIVYNKSAAVLHMLRRLLGDDAFFRGLRRFYQEWRFRKAGSDDLRLAFEAESHRPLARFFERWIYDSRLPSLAFSSRTEHDVAGGRDTIVVRFEQAGDLFDVPVTVTLDYVDRPAVDVVVAVTDAVTEMRIPLDGRLRSVDVNRDRAALARIEKK
jgi:hypothetical protein